MPTPDAPAHPRFAIGDSLHAAIGPLSRGGGNAFAIIGACQAALRQLRAPRATADAFAAEAMRGDYAHLLATTDEWFGSHFLAEHQAASAAEEEDGDWDEDWDEDDDDDDDDDDA